VSQREGERERDRGKGVENERGDKQREMRRARKNEKF
jgi:hypothetical protein